MYTQRYPTSLFLFVLVILIFQVIAERFYWYWRIWWFDMPMHFAGGLWVGFSVLWFVFLSGKLAHRIKQSNRAIFIVGIFSVLTIAIAWEIFEYIVQVLFPQGTPYDILDTLSDILFGFLGGITASFIFFKKRYTGIYKPKL